MAEKEFFKNIPAEGPEPSPMASEIKSKLSGWAKWLFIFVKFILGILLLPFVYSISSAFYSQFMQVDPAIQDIFWWGIAAFLLIYLFVWEPAKIYTRGQKILEWIFTFVRPLVRIAPYLLPVYTILLLVLYACLSWAFEGLLGYFIFWAAFSLSLHLVYSAKTLRTKKEDALKANYLFGFSLIYIINIFLLSLCLSVILKGFDFVIFCRNFLDRAGFIFQRAYEQLFLFRK
ncbi:MAG: hypothetical protein MUF05_00225 [Candidatus Omnitrophica bacterium]|jgi:hypothetical protein|nr:hypothetical protein [Candidatus Omnitrophota bacterium]